MMSMIERTIYANTQKIKDPTLRGLAESAARLVLENWAYLLFVIVLWRFPYIVADLTDTEVQPRRPTGDSVFWQSEMARALALTCLAMSYNLLFGFSGVISFGHALFFGAGGYVTFIVLNEYDASYQQGALIVVIGITLILALFSRMNVRQLLIIALIGVLLTLLLMPGEGTLSFYQAIGLAVVASIAVSLISGVVTLRLRGIYFAMFTLALAEMFWVLAKSGTFRDITGAEDGLGFRDILPESFNPTPTFDGSRLDMYRLTVVFFVIVFIAIRRYLNSPVGRVMIAIRENEERARTIGYNTFYYKVLTMTFAGVIATLSGLLFVIWATDKRVHPEALSLKYTVDPLLNSLIGGIGTLTGPVIATLGLSLGETYLRNETFTLDTGLFGILTVWQLAVVLVVGLVWWLFRRPLQTGLRRVVDMVRRDTARAATFASGTHGHWALILGYYGLVVLLLLAVGLVIGSEIAHNLEFKGDVYNVSDLWELFLGILFVVVVMALPHGIVGTWNTFWANRRVRRLEQSAQQSAPKGNNSAS
ncbi:MAG: branched-chain amino acid ABC transporter permease [Anaerolineae bacterium]|nr:branched-chain amino acid ABC transporter permease [Anaerolineae bacterium]